MEPGGAGNFLIAGSRLGMEMTALGAAGKDMYSIALLDMLAEEGVKVDGMLHQAQGSTTTVFVLEDSTHRHVFLGQFGQGDDVPLLEDWKQRIRSVDAVQFWGYSLNEVRLIDCVLEAAEFAKGLGNRSSLIRGRCWFWRNRKIARKLLSCATVVLCTEDELVVLGEHCQVLNTPAGILGQGPEVLCIKHGQDGCKIFTCRGDI